jgi:hypothetical protein
MTKIKTFRVGGGSRAPDILSYTFHTLSNDLSQHFHFIIVRPLSGAFWWTENMPRSFVYTALTARILF